jgi:hypothetical protein
MLAAIFLASQLHFLANKHAVLAGCSAFWPVNCIFLHKKCGHVEPLSGPSVTDLYSVPKWKGSYHGKEVIMVTGCCQSN